MLDELDLELFEDISLGDLFTLSDAISNKYLTDEEIAERDKALETAKSELEAIETL